MSLIPTLCVILENLYEGRSKKIHESNSSYSGGGHE